MEIPFWLQLTLTGALFMFIAFVIHGAATHIWGSEKPLPDSIITSVSAAIYAFWLWGFVLSVIGLLWGIWE